MINCDDITKIKRKKSIKERNLNWLKICDDPYRILILKQIHGLM